MSYLKTVCLLLILGAVAACSRSRSDAEEFEPALRQGLSLIGQDRSALTLPKLPYPVSTAARMPLVDRSLQDPTTMVGLTRRLLSAGERDGSRASYAGEVLDLLGAGADGSQAGGPESVSMQTLMSDLQRFSAAASPPSNASWSSEAPADSALRTLLNALLAARRGWSRAVGDLGPDAVSRLQSANERLLRYRGQDPDSYRPLDEVYHQAGSQVDLQRLSGALVRLLQAIEHALPALAQLSAADDGEWQTPLGKVKIAGTGNDRHHGEYWLLIDRGGDDNYEEVSGPTEAGGAGLVIDLAGNDQVHWGAHAGPGAGLLGLSVWVDQSGDDRYSGESLGLGVGVLGAGVLWDRAGNDTYQARSLSQGAGLYGIGLLMDDQGDDHFRSAVNSQGFGVPGGIGILTDFGGNDSYYCGGVVPDAVAKRIARHQTRHYLSLCQGFGFGLRPKISGGIGLLLDREGDDRYQVDIFGQGASYWFGLGILVDGAGNDDYEGFEHVQGEGLHLSAGVLSDWDGDDQYRGYEHAQGVGKDRSAGVLYEAAGNDVYLSYRQSQGAGLSSYGVGMLIDRSGNDRYRAHGESQGYSGRPDIGFPDEEWPIGFLLDLEGNDDFDQPGSDPVGEKGRVQNLQGVAIDGERR